MTETRIMSKTNKPTVLSIDTFEKAAGSAHTLILDGREKGVFSKGFIPGSLFIGLEGDFTYWAQHVLPAKDVQLLLVAPETQVADMSRLLREAGFANIQGYLEGGFDAWKAAGKPIDDIPTIDVGGLAKDYQAGKIEHILDVRRPDEYEARHIKDAALLPLEVFRDRINEVDLSKTYQLHCRSGYRSTVAASMLKAKGSKALTNLHGMIDDVFEAGIPAAE